MFYKQINPTNKTYLLFWRLNICVIRETVETSRNIYCGSIRKCYIKWIIFTFDYVTEIYLILWNKSLKVRRTTIGKWNLCSNFLYCLFLSSSPYFSFCKTNALVVTRLLNEKKKWIHFFMFIHSKSKLSHGSRETDQPVKGITIQGCDYELDL